MADEKKEIHDIHAKGDVVLGNQTTFIIQMQPFQPPSPDLARLRHSYYEHIQDTYRTLDFKGIPQLDNLTPVLLEDVYVPLLARPQMPTGETLERRIAGRVLDASLLPEEALLKGAAGEAAPVSIEEALAKYARVVTLGDPGSGKSTLLKHLALRLAGEADGALPILIPLNAYDEALAQADCNLQEFLPRYFAGQAKDVACLQPLFEAAIEQGRALIMLDGLDEAQSKRAYLAHKIEQFSRDVVRKGNKVIATSRIVGYRDAPLSPADWTLYTLEDFSQQQIEGFAEKWCYSIEKALKGASKESETAAEVEKQSLLEALQANSGVARLASNPLLLTILALIKRQGVSLPNRRVELYELYLKTLISSWNQARTLNKRPLGHEMNYNETVSVLGPLALWLREENPTYGLIPEERLLEWLTGFFEGDEWGLRRADARKQAGEFLKSVRECSNLLVERGKGSYGFIHLTFEEALAARGLTLKGQLRLDESLKIIETKVTDAGWRETILLAVGIWGLVNMQPKLAGEVVKSLLKISGGTENPGAGILMAGACLEDVGESGVGRLTAREVHAALWDACQDRTLPPAVQRDAGFILGRTGWVIKDLDALVNIQAGEFLYGEVKGRRTTEKLFQIAKYPVTNLQYKRFLQARGYERRELWSEEGWQWRTGNYDSKAPEHLQNLLKSRPVEKRGEPFYWQNRRWNNPLAPVVGVSWFEAQAYCNWLAGDLGRAARLPLEEEWERAARGTTGAEYPWGNEFDPRRLNCSEWWSGKKEFNDKDWQAWGGSIPFQQASTTMVGQFLAGSTPGGISDLSGNVWEWCESWFFDEKKNTRVLRGGSWDSQLRGARCAFRYRGSPDVFDYNLGFRVLLP